MAANTRANCFLIPLSNVPRAIQVSTGKPGPEYRRCYVAVIDGRIPAVQINGRWFVQQADLPTVAHTLGIPVPTNTIVSMKHADATIVLPMERRGDRKPERPPSPPPRARRAVRQRLAP